MLRLQPFLGYFLANVTQRGGLWFWSIASTLFADRCPIIALHSNFAVKCCKCHPRDLQLFFPGLLHWILRSIHMITTWALFPPATNPFILIIATHATNQVSFLQFYFVESCHLPTKYNNNSLQNHRKALMVIRLFLFCCFNMLNTEIWPFHPPSTSLFS